MSTYSLFYWFCFSHQNNSIGYIFFLILGPQFISRITNNTQWKQHGITVAGGNRGGGELNQLDLPFGLSIDNERQSICIADFDNHRIVEWKLNTKSGQVIAGGNGRGNQMNQLNGPTDVTVDTKNNSLIICDQENRRVVERSRQNGTKNGQILIPDIDCGGITMDINGYIYVSDYQKDEVRRWKRGETNGIIVAGGNGEGNHLAQLNYPTYLFVDQDDSLYVSDYDNHRVMKWMKNTKEGIIVAGGQGQGDKLTQLNGPQGVIVDHLGNVYVADSNNDQIMCWSKGSEQGRIIVGENGYGKQSNQLDGPSGISFDREDNLYVVDMRNRRVQKFEIDKY